MFYRIYKFLVCEIRWRVIANALMPVIFVATFAVGTFVGIFSERKKQNHCEANLELVKQGAKQCVLEFFTEFGLEYRKKAK